MPNTKLISKFKLKDRVFCPKCIKEVQSDVISDPNLWSWWLDRYHMAGQPTDEPCQRYADTCGG